MKTLNENEIDQITEKIIDKINDILLDEFGSDFVHEENWIKFVHPIFNKLIEKLDYRNDKFIEHLNDENDNLY